MGKHSIHYVLTLDDQPMLTKDYNLLGTDGTKTINHKGRDIASHLDAQSSLQLEAFFFLRVEDDKVEKNYMGVFTKGRSVLGTIIIMDNSVDDKRVYFKFQGVLDTLEIDSKQGEYTIFKLVIKLNQIKLN